MTDFYILKVNSFFVKSGEELTSDVFSAHKFPANQLNQACSYRDKLNSKLNSDTVKVSRLCNCIIKAPILNLDRVRGQYA